MDLESEASEQSVCMWSTEMFVGGSEMRRQRSSSGEHLQSAFTQEASTHFYTITALERSSHGPFDLNPGRERKEGRKNTEE